MSLNLFARQTFPAVLETKLLLKSIGSPLWGTYKFYEISSLNIRNKCYRQYSVGKEKEEIIKSQLSGGEVSTFESVKETTKTLTYSGVIMVGLGITGFISYIIFNELFSKNSPMNIYSKALDRCLKNEKVLLSLGEPIKAFGEENSRGRRLHTNHHLYKKDGVNHLRMHFYIKGSRKKATVHLEMKENESRNFEYRYLFVQLDEFPYTTIVLEDNRGEKATDDKPAFYKVFSRQTSGVHWLWRKLEWIYVGFYN